MAVQPSLSGIRSNPPKTGFLTTRLILKLPLSSLHVFYGIPCERRPSCNMSTNWPYQISYKRSTICTHRNTNKSCQSPLCMFSMGSPVSVGHPEICPPTDCTKSATRGAQFVPIGIPTKVATHHSALCMFSMGSPVSVGHPVTCPPTDRTKSATRGAQFVPIGIPTKVANHLSACFLWDPLWVSAILKYAHQLTVPNQLQEEHNLYPSEYQQKLPLTSLYVFYGIPCERQPSWNMSTYWLYQIS